MGAGDDDRRLGEERGARLRRARPCGRARGRGGRSRSPAASRAASSAGATASQSGQLAQRAQRGARHGREPECELDHDQPPLRRRREELEVDPGREHAVVAGEALGGGRGDLAGGARAARRSVRAASRAARVRGRVGESLGREERRDGERLGVAEREVGDARQPRLEAVDDVEAALAQGERDVRADADRNAEARAPGDRHRRPDRDHLRSLAAVQGAAAGEQVGRAARRREHGDRVPERPQLPRDPGHVLVDVVRLRPRERRHEAEAETHAPSVALSVPLPRRAHDRRGPGTLGSRFERTWPTLVQRGQPGRRRVAPSRATQQRPTVCWSSCRCCGPSVVLRPRSEGSRRVACPGQAGDAIPSQWSCRFLLRLPDGSDSRHRPGR